MRTCHTDGHPFFSGLRGRLDLAHIDRWFSWLSMVFSTCENVALGRLPRVRHATTHSGMALNDHQNSGHQVHSSGEKSAEPGEHVGRTKRATANGRLERDGCDGTLPYLKPILLLPSKMAPAAAFSVPKRSSSNRRTLVPDGLTENL